MIEMATDDRVREFTVLTRSIGAVRCPDPIIFELSPGQRVTVSEFSTDEGVDVPIPRGLYLEVHGPATSFKEARESFPGVAIGISAILSFAANAYAGDPALVSVYECTPSAEERGFYQRLLPTPQGLPRPIRKLPIPATGHFFSAALAHPAAGGRLARAIGQYHQALAMWTPGHEILMLAHLFMAVDTVTPVLLQSLCSEWEVDRLGLAQKLDVDITQLNWASALDGAIRLQQIFEGNRACYQSAKKASDGFEHGFLSFKDIREYSSEDIRLKTAGYCRRAILRLLRLEDSIFRTLTSDPHHDPLQSWDVVAALSGTIRADDAGLLHGLVADGPLLAPQIGLASASRNDDGQLTFQPTFRATGQNIPPGVQVQLDGIELWGPKGPTVTGGPEVQRLASPPESVEH